MNVRTWIFPNGSARGYVEISGRRHHYSIYLDVLNYDPWEAALKVSLPMLIVSGDVDEICPHEEAVRLHSLVPLSKLATIYGMKHRFEEPYISQVTAVIGAWLDGD